MTGKENAKIENSSDAIHPDTNREDAKGENDREKLQETKENSIKGPIKGVIETTALKKRPLSRHESLKEFLVMTDSDGEKVTLENEGLDSVISKQETELTDEERMLLYEKAMSFKGLGSNNHALLCFLGCLKGLKPSSKSKFTMLPQCLTHISEIYALAGDYQRAVEFMQGTKLYYETAIIEAGMQVDKYKEKGGEDYKPLDFDPCLDEAKRANEYERLSSSCLEQKKFQLALEYCGKATKLRQTVYGDEHPLTLKSLDLFTLIYAEMGKSQYSEAMSKVGDIVKQIREEQKNDSVKEKKEPEAERKNSEAGKNTGTEDGPEEIPASDSNENKAEEQNENLSTNEAEQEHGKSHVTLKKPITDAIQETESLKNFTFRQVILFIILSAILAILMTYVWCHISESTSCPTWYYFQSKAKFFYYYYLVPSDADTNYV